MDLEILGIFVKVAELASFTRAAEVLGIPKARVSTSVQHLEAQLGARLLHRTTRAVHITQDGEQFLERCKELLANAEELQTMFHQAPSALRGRLRVDMGIAFARDIVIPRLPKFLAAHPQLEVELSTTDRRVDLVHEGFDCVVRVGNLRDSGMVARHLGVLPLINCASPAYLAAHGTPHSLEDLDHHLLVHYSSVLGGAPLGWEYRDGDEYRFRSMPGVLTVNNTDAYRAACIAGLGLIQAPAMGMRQLIAQGVLVEVLPEFQGEPMPVSLLYPHRRNLSKRLLAFMAWVTQVLQSYVEPDRPGAAAGG